MSTDAPILSLAPAWLTWPRSAGITLAGLAAAYVSGRPLFLDLVGQSIAVLDPPPTLSEARPVFAHVLQGTLALSLLVAVAAPLWKLIDVLARALHRLLLRKGHI